MDKNCLLKIFINFRFITTDRTAALVRQDAPAWRLQPLTCSLATICGLTLKYVNWTSKRRKAAIR
jgi:hypothetical protein